VAESHLPPVTQNISFRNRSALDFALFKFWQWSKAKLDARNRCCSKLIHSFLQQVLCSNMRFSPVTKYVEAGRQAQDVRWWFSYSAQAAQVSLNMFHSLL
jgi:hypothetical protein